MTLRIPTSTTLSDYRQTSSLDGRDYIFRFLWNQREATWFFSLLDQEGDPIVEGVKVVANYPLLRLVVDDRRPPGILIALDTQAQEESADQKSDAQDPGLTELGERVVLLYYTAADVAELGLEAAV